MENQLTEEFLADAVSRFEQYTPKIARCFDELGEDEIWKRPNSSSNSIGNLVLHLCGNIRQYIISSLGGKEDIRERDKEFSAEGGLAGKELLDKLQGTVSEAIAIIKKTDAENLARRRIVQGFNHTGLTIILHVVEHFAYHDGQIIFWTKLLKDKDMSFYKGIDLNKKNNQ